MNAQPNAVPDYEAEWADEHRRLPGMSKETFVRNHLTDCEALSALGWWMRSDESLHGKVIEGGFDGFTDFVSVPAPEGRDGDNWVQVDCSRPFLRVRISLEIIADGDKQRRPSSDVDYGW